MAAGIDNIDIGCMQINWHWHGTAFASPAAALSPAINAAYAAVLLQGYKRRSGSWAKAVGLYHSHTPALAEAYRCRVARELRPGTVAEELRAVAIYFRFRTELPTVGGWRYWKVPTPVICACGGSSPSGAVTCPSAFGRERAERTLLSGSRLRAIRGNRMSYYQRRTADRSVGSYNR